MSRRGIRGDVCCVTGSALRFDAFRARSNVSFDLVINFNGCRGAAKHWKIREKRKNYG